MDPAITVANHYVGFDGTVWWAENPPLGPSGEDQGPDAPSLRELRDSSLGRSAQSSSDPAANHPPAYYATLALPWTVLQLDRQPPSGAVLGLRLASLLLLVPVPWLVAASASAVGLRPQVAVAASFVPSAWIQFVHIGAAVNSGALVVLTTSLVVALCVPVILRGDVGSLRALLLGLTTSLGVLAKGFAFGLVAIVVLAYLAAMKRSGSRTAGRALLWALVGMLPGAVWWSLNLDRLLGLDPASGVFGEGDAGPIAFSLWRWFTRALADLSGSFWANLGWLNTSLPPALHFLASIAFVVLLAVGMWRLRRTPVLVVALTATWSIPLLMIALWSLRYYERNGFVDGMQGRYLQAGVVAFSLLIVTALEPLGDVLRAVPFAAIAIGVGGLVFGLRSFWDPPSLGTVASWWPMGAAVLAGAILALVTSLAILIGAPTAGRARRSSANRRDVAGKEALA